MPAGPVPWSLTPPLTSSCRLTAALEVALLSWSASSGRLDGAVNTPCCHSATPEELHGESCWADSCVVADYYQLALLRGGRSRPREPLLVTTSPTRFPQDDTMDDMMDPSRDFPSAAHHIQLWFVVSSPLRPSTSCAHYLLSLVRFGVASFIVLHHRQKNVQLSTRFVSAL